MRLWSEGFKTLDFSLRVQTKCTNSVCSFHLLNEHDMCVSRMLRSNQISCIDNSTFTGLSSVRLLSLYDNRISSIAPGAFSTLHSLSTMWVYLAAFSLVLIFLFFVLSVPLFSQRVPQSLFVHFQIYLNLPLHCPCCFFFFYLCLSFSVSILLFFRL